MRKILSLRNVLISCFILLIGSMIALSFNAIYGGKDFRTMQDKISSSEKVNITGLREIKASGGSTPRIPYVYWKLSGNNNKIIFLDLKTEFHGYVHGVHSTFLGYHSGAPGIRHMVRRVLLTQSMDIQPDMIVNEEDELKKYGIGYKKIAIPSKFVSTDAMIDELIHFFETESDNAWIHVHCANGHGRTTMALSMLDIIKNAPAVPLEDIVKRQYLLGSVDLFDTRVWARGHYTQEQLDHRKAVIVNFYDFICQKKAGGIQTYSEWNKQKTEGMVNNGLKSVSY